MERQTIQEFIELYRNEPSLWKIRCSHYNNRAVKNAAYRRMVAKLREVHPDANLALVKRKINALRTNYRKELRKVQASQERNRLTGESVYIPSLWYYDLFHFIAEQENEQQQDARDRRDVLAVDYDENIQYDSDDFDEDFENPDSLKSSKKATAMESHQMGVSPSYDSMEQQRQDYCFKQENQWYSSNGTASPVDGQESFGRYVGSKLREMDTTGRVFAERLISEILFRGQMGMLTKHTTVSEGVLHTDTKNEE